MTEIPLHFELPENLTANKLFKKLSKKIDFEIASHQYTIKTFYDSFDWRLYNADMVCEFNHSQTASQLNLINRKSGQSIALENMQNIPAFSDYFPRGHLKMQLEERLGMRALLPICHLPYEAYRINILNKDKKMVLRIQVDEYELLTNCIHLQPLKGYKKTAKNISDLLQQVLNLKPADYTVLNTALKQQGRKAKDYSSKFTIQLKPEMRVDKASKLIYMNLLQAIHANEAGAIANTDSEFLHDFRVAVRRTRAGLSQIKNTLPKEVIAQHTDFFSWLNQITGPTRDMDVYLLSYKQYKAALPITLRDDLAPLYTFLEDKHTKVQTELAEKLKSTEYKKKLAAWEQYLKEPLPKKGKGSHANLMIKELADQRIWKAYRHLLKEGEAITDDSPAETLHDLRKTCKKLRYLMEFFQSLYHKRNIKVLLKALKSFQTVLGDFQDYEVQEIKIRQFSEEMMANNVSSNTFLAVDVLVQYLDNMKRAARKSFSEQFALFNRAKNQTMFKTLFSN
jgi:CHAD domain-containing protein